MGRAPRDGHLKNDDDLGMLKLGVAPPADRMGDMEFQAFMAIY